MQPKQEIKRFFESFRNAARGISSVIRYERNFKVHICMMLYVMAFSLIGKVGFSSFSKFLICFGVVMAAELFNTSIELLCDEITEEYRERIKNIKDISAGAVLVTAVFSAIVGLSVFLSKEVLCQIGQTFVRFPFVAVLVALSLPCAILFIVKRDIK